MGLFDNFPYTNFHELNLMWILEALKEIQTTTEQFVAINSLKYADPIQWNIVQQYEKNTIVIDPLTGTAYISVQPVPSGVALTNTDYWTVVFDLGSFVTRAAKNFTNRWEADTTLTATFPTLAGEWLVWGDTLYVALVNITAGDQYVVDSNIQRITIEEVKNDIYNIMGALADLNTTDKSNLVAAINEVLTTLVNTSGDLDDLSTTDKSNLVAAINEVLTTLVNTSGDLDDLLTTDKDNIVDAINEVVNNIGSLATLPTTDKSSIVNSIREVFDRFNFTSYVNVKDFGAKGDYATDDTQAFLDAITYCNTHDRKTIYVPYGYYLISQKLTLNYLSMIGDQMPMLVPNADGMDCVVEMGHESCLYNMRFVADHGHVANSHIYVSGNFTMIHKCLIQQHNIGVKLGEFVDGVNDIVPTFPIITKTAFGGGLTGGTAIYARRHANMIIESCQIIGQHSDTDQPDAGIRICDGDTAVINNCNITWNGCSLMIKPPVNESIYSVYANNCLFDNAGDNHSCCEIHNTGNKITDISFTNCWFGGAKVADGLSALGASGSHLVSALKIVGCQLCSNQNNGLTMNYCEAPNIIGNTFSGNVYNGIQMGVGVGNGMIIGNRIGLTDRGTNGNGIKIDTPLIGNIIVGNVMFGNTYDTVQGDRTGTYLDCNYPVDINTIFTGTMKYDSGDTKYWNGSAWTIPTGSVRYNASQLQYWNGSAWTNI